MANSTGKLIAAFLAGAAAGASLGILLAPDKGINTRKKVKDTFDDMGAKAADALKKAQEAYDKFTKHAKPETTEEKV
jgi:gas vesicle protein